MVGPVDQKMLKFWYISSIKVYGQSHLTMRLKNEKYFSNEKNLILATKISWSKP